MDTDRADKRRPSVARISGGQIDLLRQHCIIVHRNKAKEVQYPWSPKQKPSVSIFTLLLHDYKKI